MNSWLASFIILDDSSYLHLFLNKAKECDIFRSCEEPFHRLVAHLAKEEFPYLPNRLLNTLFTLCLVLYWWEYLGKSCV